ncbi:response regulator transcription factor [Bacillus sp. B1-b2]|uniref:response regulator transcription factor n=1 Tax=Bacillus sp. B1-b2 TaxID=2653201 RepID=UPI001262A40A|nr:response regulator transcription factor [Bacillus sp. B1-b2]KAB7665044.1 response regulator transcription factor [Bacillus sp. B1-b2]
MRILIVEDEMGLAEALAQILMKNHYYVDIVNDGETGLDYILTGIYDLLLLDIMLPEIDGITILRAIREKGIATPVILLSAKGDISDKVSGLDNGADDYMAKPFSTDELLARIRAALRRNNEVVPDDSLKFGDLELTMSTLMLSCKEKELKLILKEGKLLELLLIRKNTVTSKEQIIEKLWGLDSDVEHNNVEVYISFLRKKLVFLHSTVQIKTIRGVGYMVEVISDVHQTS